MEAFKLKNEQLSISGRSLFGSETSEKPIMPLYRGPDKNLNENPDLETAFQMPANLKEKINKKGGFSKTIKNTVKISPARNPKMSFDSFFSRSSSSRLFFLYSSKRSLLPVLLLFAFLVRTICKYQGNFLHKMHK